MATSTKAYVASAASTPPFKEKIMHLARNTDPMTSWMAAAQANGLAKDHAIIIVDCLQRHGALGKDGIMLLSKLDRNQISRRLPELERQGLIKQTGQLVKSLSNRLEREWAFQPQQKELI